MINPIYYNIVTASVINRRRGYYINSSCLSRPYRLYLRLRLGEYLFAFWSFTEKTSFWFFLLRYDVILLYIGIYRNIRLIARYIGIYIIRFVRCILLYIYKASKRRLPQLFICYLITQCFLLNYIFYCNKKLPLLKVTISSYYIILLLHML